MKIIIAFSLLIVSITALPKTSSSLVEAINSNDERFITGNIVQAIEEVSQAIKDAGLDPFHIESYEADYALPVDVLFNTQIEVLECLVTGLSNIVVHRINYGIITNRLTFDIRLPLIEALLEKASQSVTVFGSSTAAHFSGRVAIVGIRLEGTIRVNVGIISGISIRSVDMDFTLGRIESDVNAIVHGKDYSDNVNTLLGEIIPGKIAEYRNEINELLEIIVTQIAESIL